MKYFVLSIFLFIPLYNLQSQIIGRVTCYDGDVCFSTISANYGEQKNTNSEGYFELPLTKIKNVVLILSGAISIEIKNIPNSKKINIGEIITPERKSISIAEYKNLSEKEKEFCIPVHHWNQLLGYEFKNQLSEPCIKFKCGEVKYEVCEFKFDIVNQKVIIDWNSIKKCEK